FHFASSTGSLSRPFSSPTTSQTPPSKHSILHPPSSRPLLPDVLSSFLGLSFEDSACFFEGYCRHTPLVCSIDHNTWRKKIREHSTLFSFLCVAFSPVSFVRTGLYFTLFASQRVIIQTTDFTSTRLSRLLDSRDYKLDPT